MSIFSKLYVSRLAIGSGLGARGGLGVYSHTTTTTCRCAVAQIKWKGNTNSLIPIQSFLPHANKQLNVLACVQLNPGFFHLTLLFNCSVLISFMASGRGGYKRHGDWTTV